MPGSKSHQREYKYQNRRAVSFHGRGVEPVREMLMRPRTVPDLLAGSGGRITEEVRGVRPTKLLLNVTVQRSLGAVQVLMMPESTVGDLIAAALRQYKKEGRRPVVDGVDAGGFDLHYSQFSLESLNRNERLIKLGSRNFFLFPRKSTPAAENSDIISDSGGSISASSCSKQAEKPTKIAVPWLKFMF